MTRARINADQAHTESLSVVPHIIPDVLYPAVAGKLLDGSTSHGATYGVAQGDGRSYYYTDIKGSKPIKDPRIGSHFGSQRHKFKSFQLIEQETATHGSNVYFVDGREWMRAVGADWTFGNNQDGNMSYPSNSAVTGANYIEFTGYFNAVNWMFYTLTANDCNITIDGTTNGSVFTGGTTTVGSPIVNRFVDGNSVVSMTFDSTPSLGIHTVKVSNVNGDYMRSYGLELIAQDTTSATTKSQIQIPSQNVVSYGKKFTVSETKHYNPFAFKTDGTTAWASGAHNGTAWPIGTGSSTNIDTATSLGLSAWVSTNYYKPYNGGRVVKWVASDGTIKTSVNVMPPNARSIGNSASLTNATAKANASIANNTFYPTMEAGAVDHSLAEVAKTYSFREFGNGSANGGTSATYADASMLTGTEDDFAYVMDDGLTSLSGNAKVNEPNMYRVNADSFCYLTFIGTGILKSVDGATPTTIAQNLPYGTHIFYQDMGADADHADWYIDGVQVQDERDASNGTDQEKYFKEMSIFQPKMPPIPEDAVVIADYMLMADFVVKGAGAVGKVSKGIRQINASRDVFYDGSGNVASVEHIPASASEGFRLRQETSHATNLIRIPAFAINASQQGYYADVRYQNFYINDTAHSSAVTTTKVAASPAGWGAFYYPTSNVTLGNNIFESYGTNAATQFSFTSWEVASPIHTSSHYQTFETPFMHELVGGDRNMEQTNLVVTPDGKTWDQVTRDTSYIGNVVCHMATDTATTWSTIVVFDEWRGTLTASSQSRSLFTKDFAIAYDRLICLRDGQYELFAMNYSSAAGNCVWMKNGGYIGGLVYTARDNTPITMTAVASIKRGDYVQLKGNFGNNNMEYNDAYIKRID
jgi:hypothetical protein